MSTTTEYVYRCFCGVFLRVAGDKALRDLTCPSCAADLTDPGGVWAFGMKPCGDELVPIEKP